jgi:hypothetical protein
MKGSHEDRSSSISPRRQAAEYFDRLFGWGEGTVRYAVGVDGHFNEQGAYTTKWREYSFNWLSQRQGLIAVAMADAAEDDVYCRTTLRNYRHSGERGYGLGSEYCWADFDKPTRRNEKRLTSVLSDGSFIVHSGQPGHKHPYIKLDGVYSWEVIQDLNHRLDHFLDGGGKWAENTALRVPGTLNHKGRAAGGESYPVTMEVVTGIGIAPWSPEALRERLGPAPAHPAAAGASKPGRRRTGEQSRSKVAPIVPVDPEPRPTGLSDRIMALVHFGPENNPKGDQSRSGQLYRLVVTLIEEGLTDGQVMGMALYSEPGQEKYPDEDDLMREIQRIINKVRPNHQHPGLTCKEAACVTEVHPEIARTARAIRGHFDAHYGTPLTLASDTKVLDAVNAHPIQQRAIVENDSTLVVGQSA